jgi:hypothetical protein
MKELMTFAGIVVLAGGLILCSGQAGAQVPGMEGLPPGSLCRDIDDDSGKCEEAIDPKTKTVYEKKWGKWKVDQDDTLKAQGGSPNVKGMEGLPAGSRCTDIDDDSGKCEEAIDPKTKTVYEKKRGKWKVDQEDTLKAQGKLVDD